MKLTRAPGTDDTTEAEGTPAPTRMLATPFGADDAELLLDLLEATTLVDASAMTEARARAAADTPVTQALVDEGAATSDGIARMLAVRHHLPVVDLPSVGVAVGAAQLKPFQTLERSVAIPYAVEDDILKVAVADPGNLHAIDELRLATKHSLDLGVASRDDILAELQRLLRTAEAIGSVVAVGMDEEVEAPGDADDLEADDGSPSSAS